MATSRGANRFQRLVRGQRPFGVVAAVLGVLIVLAAGEAVAAWVGPQPGNLVAKRLQNSALHAPQDTFRNVGDTGDEDGNKVLENSVRGWQAGLLATALAFCVGFLAPAQLPGNGVWPHSSPAWAVGTTSAGDRVNRDPRSLLSLALPLETLYGKDNVKTVRTLQKKIESIQSKLIIREFGQAGGNLVDAKNIVANERPKLLKQIVAERKDEAESVLQKLQALFPIIQKAIQTGENASMGSEQDLGAAQVVEDNVIKAQDLVDKFEMLMLPPGYRTPVPKEYANIPQLQGRASVEFSVDQQKGAKKKYVKDDVIMTSCKFRVVIDGWSAPVSAGAFIQQASEGFYDGLKVIRSDSLALETGDNGQGGYKVDGKVRLLPLEVTLRDREKPLYNETLDDAGLVGAEVRIPFQADGTLAFSRDENDEDSTASGQVFIFNFDPDLTPPGRNFLDGRYSAMGYTFEGANFLRQIKEGDTVTSVKVLYGLENLVKP